MSWDLDKLGALLSKQTDLVVTREADCLLIANTDDLEAWVAISGEQILMESILFAQSEVTDTKALNESILKTHMLFPLTAVGISDINGESYYTAFGSLSIQSRESSILIEVETTFQNVESFLDAYQDYLR